MRLRCIIQPLPSSRLSCAWRKGDTDIGPLIRKDRCRPPAVLHGQMELTLDGCPSRRRESLDERRGLSFLIMQQKCSPGAGQGPRGARKASTSLSPPDSCRAAQEQARLCGLGLLPCPPQGAAPALSSHSWAPLGRFLGLCLPSSAYLTYCRCTVSVLHIFFPSSPTFRTRPLPPFLPVPRAPLCPSSFFPLLPFSFLNYCCFKWRHWYLASMAFAV